MTFPPPIQAYFDANARLDAGAMLAPFAADAVVRDAGHIRQGKAAVRTWIEEASIKVPAIASPATINAAGDLHDVTARVAGNFPGSPVTLAFRFRLDRGRIAELEIK